MIVFIGAGNGIRTRDLQLGKLKLLSLVQLRNSFQLPSPRFTVLFVPTRS